MSVDAPKPSRWLRIGILVACFALECSLIWFNCFRGSGVQNGGLLSFASLALLIVLSATGILPVPSGIRIPFFNVWPSLSDSAKAIASFLGIFAWTPLAKQLVPDSPVGAVIVLAPDALFVIAALVYLSNGLSKGNRL